jgi:hypothetical protein
MGSWKYQTMSYFQMRLTYAELYEAACCGAARVCNVIFDDLKCPRGSETEHKWQQHIEGAIAERVVAKYLNQYWHGKSDKNAPSDVGKIVEAKSAPEHHLNLFVPVDQLKPESVYYLVTGAYNDYRIQGWMWGVDIAAYPVENHRGRGDAYRVQKNCLNFPHIHYSKLPNKANEVTTERQLDNGQ